MKWTKLTDKKEPDFEERVLVLNDKNGWFPASMTAKSSRGGNIEYTFLDDEGHEQMNITHFMRIEPIN